MLYLKKDELSWFLDADSDVINSGQTANPILHLWLLNTGSQLQLDLAVAALLLRNIHLTRYIPCLWYSHYLIYSDVKWSWFDLAKQASSVYSKCPLRFNVPAVQCYWSISYSLSNPIPAFSI